MKDNLILLQAEEAQRLRKRRKAETLRLLETERRQKQRVEEVREAQKKVWVLTRSFSLFTYIFVISFTQYIICSILWVFSSFLVVSSVYHIFMNDDTDYRMRKL